MAFPSCKYTVTSPEYEKQTAYNLFLWQAFQVLPAFMLLVGLIWLPESPRWLIEADRDDDGMKTLRKLHYDGTNDDWIQREYNEIRATISAEKAITAPGWLIMFKVPQWRKRLLQGTLVQVFTQLTGISMSACLPPRNPSTNNYRCHRILPNHHLQRSRHHRRSRCPCRRNLQLRRSCRQRHFHRLSPRPCWPKMATDHRSYRH